MIALLLLLQSPPSPAAQALLDRAISIVKAQAYWSDTVSWQVVEPQVRARASGAATTNDVYPAIRLLLESLGDHHSFVAPPSVAKGVSVPYDPGRYRVTGQALPGDVGYIRVPGFGSTDDQAGAVFASRIYTVLGRTNGNARCGWIVDLRANGGGNMWPMLAGLQPFLGDGPLGYFRSRSGGEGAAWHAGDRVAAPPVPDSLRALEHAPVAVLLGPRTASSGEAVAIAFRGRARTRSFGLPTAGLANANTTIPLPDGGMIALMVALDVDRGGNVYGHQVDPDVLVEPNPYGTTDAALNEASAWLRAESSCF